MTHFEGARRPLGRVEHQDVLFSTEADISEAQAATDRFPDSPAGGLVIGEILLLRLRSLMASACGDDTGYGAYRDRFRELATSLGFEGDMEWAGAMP